MKIATSRGVIDFTIPEKQPNSSGEVYLICPICTSTRKPEHQKEEKFAVNVRKDPMKWRCNHCGEGGSILTDEYMKRAKIKPLIKNYDYLSIDDNLTRWFWEKRKLSIATLRHFDITKSMEPMKQQRVGKDKEHTRGTYVTRKCINFKYKLNKILINIKFRDPVKNFKMIPGATLIPFNIDAILDHSVTEAVITEGELDAMAYHESSIENVISVPNGATVTEKEREIYERTGKLEVISNINLEYLDPVIDDLKHIKMFYIAADDDAAGIKLREELARRLGYERCKYIRFGDYKDEDGNPINDPNELLIKRTKATLAGTLETAYTFPIADVTTADEYLDIIVKNYREGKSKGVPTGYVSLDPFFNWVRGWPVVFNGWPNMGKTSMVLNLMAIASVKYKWKWGIYCPENYPVENVIELIAMILIGKTLDIGYSKRISEEEVVEVVKAFIKKYFFFVDNEDGFTPAEMRAIKKRMVQQHGIVGFLTDPWSALNHDVTKHGGIDEYLQNELNHEVRLTTKYNLINIICHHPRTPKGKIEAGIPPTVYELTGGKQWWMKMYAALCIHQESFDDWQNNMVGLHIQKIKVKQIAGETTSLTNYPILQYDKLSRRFYELDDPDSDSKKYNKFPFHSYLDADQSSLFEGF